MEHILVPIDFSEASLVGLKRAIEIAKGKKSEIHLVNIVKPPKTKEKDLKHTINQIKESESKLTKLISEIDCNWAKIHPQIKLDNFEKGIVKYIDQNMISLIVVGVNGAHTVGDLFCIDPEGTRCVNVKCPVEVVGQKTDQVS